MEKTQEVAVEQMRAAIEKLGSSAEGEADGKLMMFLVARSMDTEKAAEMYLQWKRWRAEIAPRGFVPDDEVVDELNARKSFLQGVNKAGHATVVILGRNHFASKDFLQFKKFVAYMMDKGLASCDGIVEEGKERVACVLDLQQLSMANLDVRGGIEGFQILQEYYPGRLTKFFIINVPFIFAAAWKIISRFLDKATAEKVQIVKTERQRKEMLKEMGEELLPAEYGGSAKLVPLQNVKLKNRPPTN
ncbi:SEC14 cytosolic factor-like [Nymphaea colorata]|nr:SEC14 cytosolic factor-like [Nymphaea colorata]